MSLPQTQTISFTSVEQLDEATLSLGWETEYRQLDAGSLISRFCFLEGESWFLLDESSSRRLEIEAPAPGGMYVLGIAAGDPAIVNGSVLTPDHIYFQSPGYDVRATMPAGLRVVQIGIEVAHFESVLRAVARDYRGFDHGTRTIATTPGALLSLQKAMSSALRAPSSLWGVQEETFSRLVAEFVAIAVEHEAPQLNCELHRAPAMRALETAKEYIDANLKSSIRVAALCRYANCNLRTLERVFSREMGVSPQQYIKARRLNAVRRDLLAAEPGPGHGVTELALAHGFSHLGRFSGDYHRHFGEYPSDTLSSH
jgi:AraC family ethanolamine operon transcriptional activator